MNIKSFLEKFKSNSNYNSNDMLENDSESRDVILQKLLEIQYQIEQINNKPRNFTSIIELVDNIKEKVFDIIAIIEGSNIEIETNKDVESILNSLNMILVEAYNQSINSIMSFSKMEAKKMIMEILEKFKEYDGNSKIFVSQVEVNVKNILENYDNIYQNYHTILCGKANYDEELLSILIDGNITN